MLRPTFSGFETAKRGLMVNQKALDIVGNNLANLKTDGYTRQRVDVASVSMYGQGDRYKIDQYSRAGQGAQITGVSQIRDSYLDKRFREEFSTVGYYEKAASVLANVETALNEYTADGLKTALKDVVTSLQNLSGNANQTTHANIVLTSMKNMVQVFNQFDGKLNELISQETFELEVDVQEVNKYLEQIGHLNDLISQEMLGQTPLTDNYYGPNELLDQRNLLLDKLSKYGDVVVSPQPDGTVTVDMNGHEVVHGKWNETINMRQNPDKTVSMIWNSTGDGMQINGHMGSLKAAYEMINGGGPLAMLGSEITTDKGIPYYKSQLDALANAMVNSINSANPGKQLLQGNTSGDITISDAWSKDPSYIIPDMSSTDSTYVMNLLGKFQEKQKIQGVSGTFEEYVNTCSTNLGQELTFYAGRMEVNGAIADDLLDQRDAISGVSMDEEGTSMMLYQKAYQAMSRLMTTMDEALDVLINKTGMVGR